MNRYCRICMQNMRNLISAICILLFLPSSSWGQSSPEFSCQGPLQPSKSLSPLPAGVRAGSYLTFDLTQQQTSNEWCQIPRWLVGDWKEKSITQTYFKDILTGRTDKTSLTLVNNPKHDFEPISGRFFQPQFWFGTQKDSNNQFWQFEGSPVTWIASMSDKSPTLEYLESDKFSVINSKHVQRRYVLTTLVFYSPDTHAGRVKSVKRRECVVDYSQVKDGIINAASCLTFFNEDGQPIAEAKTQGQFWRLKDQWNLLKWPYWDVPDGTKLDSMSVMLSKFIAANSSK